MANVVTDPYSGLRSSNSAMCVTTGALVPCDPDVRMVRGVKHAQHGVLAWRITTVLNTGTHMNAPLAHIQKGADSPISIPPLSSARRGPDIPRRTGRRSRRRPQSRFARIERAISWSSAPVALQVLRWLEYFGEVRA
jgi:hypothetical protein